jgi:hypothetical protein
VVAFMIRQRDVARINTDEPALAAG